MLDINIFALGGQDENGKNSHIVEVQNDIFVFNAGIQVPIQNKNGIDGIIPEFKYLKKHSSKVRGIFVTHAHDETFAAIPWLLMEIKGLTIYGSEFTLEAIKERVSKYKIEHNEYSFKVIKNNLKFGGVTMKAFEVANSIPGSMAYSVQTQDGDIIYLSNFVNDKLNTFGNTDLQKIKNDSNEILALMIDSRIAHFNGKSRDHKSIKPLLDSKFKNTSNDSRIIVGAYDEEMYAIEEVLELAAKYNRPVAIYGRAFDSLYKTKSKLFGKNNNIQFIDYKFISSTKNVVVLVTSTWSRLFKRFVRIANQQDVFLKFKSNDKIIMIAPPINGMEVEASQALDDVAKIAFDIIDVKETEFYKLRPAKQDIFDTVKILKPKIFIPISSLFRYLSVANQQAIDAGVSQNNTAILRNGKILHIQNGKIASQKGTLKEYGNVIIDGFGAGDISFEVIREREMLGAGGAVSILQQIDRTTKKPIEKANIQIMGLATKSELNKLNDEINSIVMQKLKELEKWDFREAQTTIRKRVRKVMSKLTNKEPLVLVTFYEI